MAQIQEGKTLKPVPPPDAGKKAIGGDARGDVMAQIRAGKNLTHVEGDPEKRKSAQSGDMTGVGGLAGALQRALEDRRKNMGLNDDEDTDEQESDNEDWSD